MSKKDLSDFWHKYQEVCEKIKQSENADHICVFPAMPVSTAFEVGRRYMHGVYLPMVIYDDKNGFFETIRIGGKK